MLYKNGMTNDQHQIDQLLSRLENLLKRQEDFSREIEHLRVAIHSLKTGGNERLVQESGEGLQEPPKIEEFSQTQQFPSTQQPSQSGQPPAIQGPSATQESLQTNKSPAPQQPPQRTIPPVNRSPKTKSDLEKFIGENLLNKIGIAVTVIGVAIGAKYAIDHELISPLTRIVLGYMAAAVLLGFAVKLKKKYENFSAVLLSGSMAIMYFITYSAYGFYNLIPQVLAFALMVVFTTFTVVAAIAYNRQVIAHIGMVGAYAIPFLLSDDSGRAAILFSYMAIINLGILAISLKKYWKPLYYSSFGLTWLIYFFWWVVQYEMSVHFGLALTFLCLFFVIFYLVLLAYKLLRKEKFAIGDIVLLLANSFVFYGIGFTILDGHDTGRHLLGLFTLCNAIVHFLASMVIYRQKLADRNLFYLVSGLVLVFITIAIPVQLDGNWVTLLWAGEAALLFWIGRSRNIATYEKLSYPLMLLAFISIVHDWTTAYGVYYVADPTTRITPLLNINFLTSILFIAAFGFINMFSRNTRHPATWAPKKLFSGAVSFLIPAILLVSIYYAFRLEISNYCDQLYIDSELTIPSDGQRYADYHHDYDLERFKTIWIINYSLLFVSILAFVNFRRLKNRQLALVNLVLIITTLLVFLVQGLYILSELRESYLEQELAAYYRRGIFNIGIRYVSFVFVTLALISCFRWVRQEFIKGDYGLLFDLLLHVCVVWILSSELISWMDIAGSAALYKGWLSVLWGTYALFLIALGIWKKKKYLRIGAITLFGITLVKLFFYDISHLGTIARTIVFVLLGVLLLIISFLYNKYKHIISDETAK